MYSIWHQMLKIASASGAPPQTTMVELTALPIPLVVRSQLRAFGARNFPPLRHSSRSPNFGTVVAPLLSGSSLALSHLETFLFSRNISHWGLGALLKGLCCGKRFIKDQIQYNTLRLMAILKIERIF